jgi:hypothetical protein
MIKYNWKYVIVPLFDYLMTMYHQDTKHGLNNAGVVMNGT